MKAEERFVNKEKLKPQCWRLGSGWRDPKSQQPEGGGKKCRSSTKYQMGEEHDLQKHIFWSKPFCLYLDLKFTSLTLLSKRFLVPSMSISCVQPILICGPFCYSCVIKISHQFCYSCAIKISAHHQVQLVLILVAGGDVIDGEIPRRSGEVENVNWNLEIFLPIWNWHDWCEKLGWPPCSGGRCICLSYSEPSWRGPVWCFKPMIPL